MADLASIRVAGAKLTADITQAVIGAPTLISSTDEVTRLSLSITDPGWEVTRTGLFAKKATVDTLDVPLEVSVVEPGPVGGVEGLTVTCRTRGAQLLKRTRGALVRRNVSPTEWIGLDAAAAGLELVAEDSARRSQIARVAEQGHDPESAWETDQRLADELGFWLFEDGRRLYFARPSWLLARRDATVWRVTWAPHVRPSDLIVPAAVPELRSSDDADTAATVTLKLPHRQGEQVRPGHVIDLAGVPADFTRRYLVTSVTVPHDGHSPVDVTASTPVDPTPQEPVE